jgi:hypothetical protein
MIETTGTDNAEEKRSESRTILDLYYSVEFFAKGTGYVYQFKLRDMSSKGLCILVNEGSVALNYLKVGETLDMKYSPPDGSGPTESLKTQIKHITKKELDSGRAQYLIGLSIIEQHASDQ